MLKELLLKGKLEKFHSNNNHHTLRWYDENKVSILFYSYGTPIALVEDLKVTMLSPLYNYSKTTTKYFRQFIQEVCILNQEEAQEYINTLEEDETITIIRKDD